MVSRAQVLSASRPDFRDIITRQASGVPGIKTTEILEQCRKKKKKKIPINNVHQTLSDKRGRVFIFKQKAKISSGGIMTSRKRASFSLGDKIYNNARKRLKVGIRVWQR